MSLDVRCGDCGSKMICEHKSRDGEQLWRCMWCGERTSIYFRNNRPECNLDDLK